MLWKIVAVKIFYWKNVWRNHPRNKNEQVLFQNYLILNNFKVLQLFKFQNICKYLSIFIDYYFDNTEGNFTEYEIFKTGWTLKKIIK